MTDKLRLRLLGQFRATGAGHEELPVSGKKTRALLGYLALETGRVHTREQLATLLWAETGDERARHNLRQELSKIRRTCPGVVVTEGDLLRLADGCDSDVGEIRRLLSSQDPDDQARAIDLYSGELLEGLVTREEGFDEWLSTQRRQLRAEVCGALDRLSSAAAATGEIDEAVERLRRLLTLDPACEEAHVQLIKLLHQSGRRSEALRQYRYCEEALERELGALPSPATKAIYDAIREAPAEAAPSGQGSAGTVPQVGQPPAIAVLPFDNLAGEDSLYFSDGFSEDVITALSRFSALTVIARPSSFAYRDGATPLDRIADELSVDYIVRGSVRRGAESVHINVELLEARSGRQVWSQRFDGGIEDVCLVQNEVTETLVATLAGRVEAARLSRARRLPPERLAAYDYVLRGKAHHHRQTPKDCDLAVEMLERAIERDPDYAVAHAWLACTLGQAMVFHPEEKDALLDRAEEEAQRGRELDDDESECHRILAQIGLMRNDLERALSHQERAVFLNPNDDRCVCAMGEILGVAGRHEEAEEWVRKAMRLNPYHPESYFFHLGRSLFHLSRDEEAREVLSRITEPRQRDLAYRLAVAARLGRRDELERDTPRLLRLDPTFDPAQFAADQTRYVEADGAALLAALHEALEAAS